MQEFNFHVTGTERKKLARAICEILITPIKYLGAQLVDVAVHMIDQFSAFKKFINLFLFCSAISTAWQFLIFMPPFRIS